MSRTSQTYSTEDVLSLVVRPAYEMATKYPALIHCFYKTIDHRRRTPDSLEYLKFEGVEKFVLESLLSAIPSTKCLSDKSLIMDLIADVKPTTSYESQKLVGAFVFDLRSTQLCEERRVAEFVHNTQAAGVSSINFLSALIAGYIENSIWLHSK